MNSPEYKKAQQRFLKNREYIHSVMNQHKLDALVMPITSQGKATYDAMTVNTWQLPIASNAGLPSIAVNAGYTNDEIPMPVGVEIIGKFNQEVRLLQIASVIEKTMMIQRAPKIRGKTTKNLSAIFSMPKYNNLLTMIGYESYIQFLQRNDTEKLSPQLFNQILKEVDAHTSTDLR